MTACIIAARRSAVMPRGGAFAALALHDLAAPVMLACLKDAGLDPGVVDEVIVANALGAGGNPARLAALAAGLPERVAGLTIDRQCAGGLDAIRLADAMIRAGQAQVILAGGVESYSRRPLRLATQPGQNPVPYDSPPFTPWPDRDPDMTAAADALAAQMGISRAQQDACAMASHAAARAHDFPEIVPILGQLRDGYTRNLTPALAGRAKVLHGTITAANAAVAADAAAFCLVVSPQIAARLQRAIRITASATLGAAPDQPGVAPVPAIHAALAAANLPATALTHIEMMEAYAAQSLACIQAAGLNPLIVNQKGGALARGHPIGASGAILAVRLFHDLLPHHGSTGLAAIAAAGGIGSALILQG